MSLTVIIIDDESLARARIRSFLNKHNDINIVGEAANGIEALPLIDTHHPDLLFLDIQMPEMDGFELIQELPKNQKPAIIFTTAFDQYSLKAFEVHALDYLLKPFNRPRFEKALERARSVLQKDNSMLELNRLITELRSKPLTRLCIKDNGSIYFVPIEQILWIESAGNYVEVHTSDTSHLMRETMTSLESRLPHADFYRVSRSAIVALPAVQEVQSSSKSDHYLVLQNRQKVKSTLALKELMRRLDK